MFEALEEALGLRSTVRLDVPNDDVRARRARRMGRFQHRVRLADASPCAEEDAQPAPLRPGLLALDIREQPIGVWSDVLGHVTAQR